MKREKVAERFEKVAVQLELIASCVDQDGEGSGDDYRKAARLVRREGVEIRERL